METLRQPPAQPHGSGNDTDFAGRLDGLAVTVVLVLIRHRNLTGAYIKCRLG